MNFRIFILSFIIMLFWGSWRTWRSFRLVRISAMEFYFKLHCILVLRGRGCYWAGTTLVTEFQLLVLLRFDSVSSISLFLKYRLFDWSIPHDCYQAIYHKFIFSRISLYSWMAIRFFHWIPHVQWFYRKSTQFASLSRNFFFVAMCWYRQNFICAFYLFSDR